MYKEVELQGGKVVKVFTPPLTKIYALVGKKYPEPKAPVRTDKTVTGSEISMIIEDDPEYLEAHDRWEDEYNTAVEEAILLFALKEENPPGDFDVEALAEEIRYFDPDWEPRTDRIGRKLDWIGWVLLTNTQDYVDIQNTIQDLLGMNQEVANQTEESFPGDVEGEAPERVDQEVEGEE
jgi:hypothetical protein